MYSVTSVVSLQRSWTLAGILPRPGLGPRTQGKSFKCDQIGFKSKTISCVDSPSSYIIVYGTERRQDTKREAANMESMSGAAVGQWRDSTKMARTSWQKGLKQHAAVPRGAHDGDLKLDFKRIQIAHYAEIHFAMIGISIGAVHFCSKQATR